MTTKITSVDQIENIKEVPTKHLKYAENFVKVGQWNGLEANIIGGGLCLGMSSYTIVGLKTARKTSKLVILDNESSDLYEVSFSKIESDLKLHGYLKI